MSSIRNGEETEPAGAYAIARKDVGDWVFLKEHEGKPGSVTITYQALSFQALTPLSLYTYIPSSQHTPDMHAHTLVSFPSLTA